jgi:alkylhydroperoxidase/carboxymuconolactone decarboxylase family protein YurZ
VLAKDVSAPTYDFLLGQPGALDRRDALLACVAATAADGSARPTREILIYALQRGLTAAMLREALLEIAPLAGAVRAEQALAALAEASVEAEKPTDPFASLLEPKERKVAPSSAAPVNDDAPSGPSTELGTGPTALDAVHGERAAKLRGRVAGRSKALARWIEEDLYGRVLARPGLTPLQRALVGLGAVFPLESRDWAADWVHAARSQGASDAALWMLADTLARLFRESPEIKVGLSGFDSILGRRVRPLED